MNKFIIVALLCGLVATKPAMAQTAVAGSSPVVSVGETAPTVIEGGATSARPADATDSGGALSSFNQAMHDFNHWAWEGAAMGGEWVSFLAPPPALREALANLLTNYINEPLSVISWTVAGDYGKAAQSARRVWINTTQGWLGIQDPATTQGVAVPSIDIGLALCARGVGEGGYIVLPFIGPRTIRDGLSDFLLVNGLTYLALAPVVGFPPSLETFLTVEIVEEAGRVAVMRQIDHADDSIASLEAAREAYLASRRERCRQIVDARDGASK